MVGSHVSAQRHSRMSPPVITRQLGRTTFLGLFLVFWGSVATAQTPPQAPGGVTRDAAGHATLRATRLPSPFTLDGRLDEPFYRTVRAEPQNTKNRPKKVVRST